MTELDARQRLWLEGFRAGIAAAKRQNAAPAAAADGPDSPMLAAQDRTVEQGGKLVAEEKAKRQRHPLDRWPEVVARAETGQFPKGIDVFLAKYHGLFYVAPAQDSFMCRLRIPNGILSVRQMVGLADAADSFGGGYADVTTRANLQIREIPAHHAVDMLMALQSLGLTARGSGADNIRNITGSATAGIDPQEVYDTRSLCTALNQHILNSRPLYGLPRKFNIAFDGGGKVPTLEDTNDIGFVACRVVGGENIEPGVYFRLQLGGITGHRDFAAETGILVKPEECIAVADAIVRAFIAHGDRTNRQKARLKYVLDRMGHEAFVAEVEKLYGTPLRRAKGAEIAPRPLGDKHGHIGVHPQKQAGFNYLGIVLPVGRMTTLQMRGLAEIAERFGSSTLRLTVWQNLLISDVADRDVGVCIAAIQALGLAVEASAIRRGLIACTGNAGCKFAASNTKGHALKLADYLEGRLTIDQPVNIHLTGCHHSCAQHYIGDIGLLACKVERDEDSVEGYHVYIGGGAAATAEQAMARDYAASIPFDDLPPLIERLLTAWLRNRETASETFFEFCRRHDIERLRDLASQVTVHAMAA
ncbi:ferredoxin-nitrite reductase [Enhydrobacter aerosaccus]|uniref:Ferredoxin-nitrite reductase n=1 Tax=Enhydrobacter aerosaccus TaxID=225324 RepID=A0A1T4QF43_9HYPH|nr:NirA family protein [Enhydrobacter aerosaccus]SKA02420.1 ferredoxin-nitrite reductase [Enhydrobacter aerosaccus]